MSKIFTTSEIGFTLIEILVVLGIAAILAGLGLVFSLDFYRSYAFNSERDLVVGLLQKARARSMSNINRTSYGICLTSGNYILFSGALSCDSNNQANEFYPAHPSINNTGLAVSFEQLRGKPTFYGNGSSSVTLSYGSGRVANIFINPEGQIEW